VLATYGLAGSREHEHPLRAHARGHAREEPAGEGDTLDARGRHAWHADVSALSPVRTSARVNVPAPASAGGEGESARSAFARGVSTRWEGEFPLDRAMRVWPSPSILNGASKVAHSTPSRIH
jgi:hypothetical protein